MNQRCTGPIDPWWLANYFGASIYDFARTNVEFLLSLANKTTTHRYPSSFSFLKHSQNSSPAVNMAQCKPMKAAKAVGRFNFHKSHEKHFSTDTQPRQASRASHLHVRGCEHKFNCHRIPRPIERNHTSAWIHHEHLSMDRYIRRASDLNLGDICLRHHRSGQGES